MYIYIYIYIYIYANRQIVCDLLIIPMFAPSVTICEISTVEMCIILILTFRTGQGQREI